MNSTTLVALSGGVDSSVAAALLCEQGHTCIGAMMKLLDTPSGNPRGCCVSEDSDDARAVCVQLGIPYYLINLVEEFERDVVMEFGRSYSHGLTPNPCINCNRRMKFGHLLIHAQMLGCTHIATGHYARIRQDGSRWQLLRALDDTKDQTYVLYFLSQSDLSQALFPLGSFTKADVRAIAHAISLETAEKRESQDICFAQKGGYADRFSDTSCGGKFLDTDGHVLGSHKGIVHYTIGQRKGIGISLGQPMYVTKICPKSNTITLGGEDMLFSDTLDACDINIIVSEGLEAGLRCTAKIRYSHKPAPAKVWHVDADRLHVVFDSPQRAITPGQAVVLYDGDVVLGGGTIMVSA